MGEVLSFADVARRVPVAKERADAPMPAGEAKILILPVVRIERHKDLICKEDIPPQGPRPRSRPRRKRA